MRTILEGAHYVAANTFFIAESVHSNDGQWIIKDIFHGDELIGITMHGYDIAEKIYYYYLCCFMPDKILGQRAG